MGLRWWVVCGWIFVLAACGDSDFRECREVSRMASPPRDDAGFVDEKSWARTQCDFDAGAKVGETVANPPDLSMVKHVIVIMRENRSFDHYLGAYDGREQESPLGDRWNPDPSTHKLVR